LCVLVSGTVRVRPARLALAADERGQAGRVTLCPICDRGEPLDVIAELESVWVTAARMAPLPGYVCVVAKRHVEEPYELPRDERVLFWDDAMRVAETVPQSIRPKKMNYQIHGNTIPHLHMHLLPRFDGNPFEGGPIEVARLEFSRTAAKLQALARAIECH
jgi:diadenosine tetraphosphate (Ap4A) HIT family hydrolase